MLKRALHRRVERVQAIERERLGRAEAAARSGIRTVVGEDAVGELEAPVLGQVPGALVEQALAEHDVAEQAALLAEADLGAVGELARLAEVVHERGGEEKVWIQTGMQLGALECERADGDGVLEQAAEVGVVTGAGAGRAAPLG